jgi:uncharacterized Zn-finger protein
MPRYGMFPVFCQSPSPPCIELPVFLGWYPLNTAARCPYCGRWTRLTKPPGGDDFERAKTLSGVLR